MSAPKIRPQSWRGLIDSGFEPRLYPWEDLPLGNRRVSLEASCWPPDLMAVICFFRDLDSEQLYRITVFRDRTTERYGPQGFDFSDVCPGTILTIEIAQTRSGKFRVQSAQLS